MSVEAMSLQAQCNALEKVEFYLRALEKVRIYTKLKDYESVHSTGHYMLKVFILDILNGNLTYNEVEQIATICVKSFELPLKRLFT